MPINRKTLVVYHYAESDQEYISNLRFFLECGLLPNVDFLFIISGTSSVTIPTRKNVRTVLTTDVGSDLIAYADCINEIYTTSHDFIIFMNCTMLGPFFVDPSAHWTDRFTDLITFQTKLVGVTINILPLAGGSSEIFHKTHGGTPPFPHVQSMLLAMDRECLEYIVAKDFFKTSSGAREDVIANYEVYLSRLILDNGWNISCLMPEYKNIDYRSISSDINPTSVCGDPWFENAYFGRSLHPYETLFFKTNRNIRAKSELQSLMATQKYRTRSN